MPVLSFCWIIVTAYLRVRWVSHAAFGMSKITAFRMMPRQHVKHFFNGTLNLWLWWRPVRAAPFLAMQKHKRHMMLKRTLAKKVRRKNSDDDDINTIAHNTTVAPSASRDGNDTWKRGLTAADLDFSVFGFSWTKIRDQRPENRDQRQ